MRKRPGPAVPSLVRSGWMRHWAASHCVAAAPLRDVALQLHRAFPVTTVGCATCRLRRRDIPLPVAGQVTSLELFFDLVFVFTITQLTATVLPGGWALTGRTALLLLILWWMYGGYAWLTNAAPPVTPRRRILLVLGMIGLFVTAMAIPHAYGSDRVVFACGYLVVVVVHAGMYVSEAARLTRGMVVQLLGWNMAGAVLGLVGALFFEDILVWWWLASFVVAVVLPRLFSDHRAEPARG